MNISADRRGFLKGIGTAGLGVAALSVLGQTNPLFSQESAASTSSLPVDEIQNILGAEGTVSNGVLTIQVDREDLSNVIGPGGIPFKPEWEINHEFYFQPLSQGLAIFNGDICVLPEESNPAIDRIVNSKLLVQMAFHQHFFELNPMVFFMHFRGVGNPIELAREIRYVVDATHTPLPQASSSMETPLDMKRLAHILHGEAQAEGAGVVTVDVDRREKIVLAGIPVKPELGVLHTIAFEPLNSDGSSCAVAPDFALIGREVNPVFRRMRRQGFQIHCLYNQETDEQPQLYFSHQLKVGNPYELAQEIRNGLNLTNSD